MKFRLRSENDPLLRRIDESIRSGHISHALLIEAPTDVDKTEFALALAKGILCPDGRGENCGSCAICDKIDHDNHEDLIFIRRPQNRQTIGIDQIRQMQAQVAIKPNGPRYIVILEESELMTEAAQNCLLKTLEEPPGGCVLMLLTENTEHLLPTIRSRCVCYRIEGGGFAADASRQEMSQTLVDQLLGGTPFYRMKQTLGSARLDRSQASELIDGMEQRCRQLVLTRDENGIPWSPSRIEHCVMALERARKQLSQGLTPGYVMKRLLLTMGE